jgi:hypothetical protein
MRQVDNFAIAALDQRTVDILLDMLDNKLTMPIKCQGLLDMFNGVDDVQTRHYIEIDCHTYIDKFCAKYLDSWLNKVPLSENRPTPLPSDCTWLEKFNVAIGPDNPKEQATLKASMQIKYRAGVGELIWAMTTCHPDIAFTSIKLSQSNSTSAEHHYHGLKQAIHYLYMTRNDGIYFWRTRPQLDLSDGPLPLIIATSATYSSTTILTMMQPLPLLTATQIGPHVSKRIAPLVEFASNLLVAQLLVKQNSN